MMIDASEEATKILIDNVKLAWFGPETKGKKHPKGDYTFISDAFWQATETRFYAAAEATRKATVDADESWGRELRMDWRSAIVGTAERLFDHFALRENDDPRNMKRISIASKSLTDDLTSKKTKAIQALLT